MRALSIKQPWAGLIVSGIKNIENRSWIPQKSVGTLAIVSTKLPVNRREWLNIATKLVNTSRKPFPDECSINGSIIGVVQFNYCVWMAKDGVIETDHPTMGVNDFREWWDPYSFGFIFENPRKLKYPIPIKGRLGLFYLDLKTEDAINRQLEK